MMTRAEQMMVNDYIKKMKVRADDVEVETATSDLPEIKDHISWDEFFMGVAAMAARRSKDPNTKVGACIASDRKIIISTGYNGMPNGCKDEEMPWGRDGDFKQTKYAYVCHAELNAILNSDGRSLLGSTIYTTCFPCNECAKAIIQSGIKKVVYLEDKYPDANETEVARLIFEYAKVDLERFTGDVV